MTTQRTHQTISSVGNTIAEDLKNSGRELNLSAFNGSTQPQSHVINQDIIVIQGGGGRGQTITTVGTKQLQGWSFAGTHNTHAFQSGYTVDDALIFNFASSVRPNIVNQMYVDGQLKQNEIDVAAFMENFNKNQHGLNLISGSNYVDMGFLNGRETVTGLSNNMTIDEFLAHVQNNGLDKNINWSNVAETLSFDSSNVNAKTFTEYSDYAAAVFVALENQIKNDFTGEEQKAELAKLNEVFTAKTQEFKDAFYNNSLSWLKEYEGDNYIKGESEAKLKASIEAVFTDKINNFRNISASNPDFAGIKGTDNQWLERDMRFMANKLMEVAGSTSTSTESGLISEKDLLDMTRLQETFNAPTTYNSRMDGGEADEEMIGLVVGSRILKAAWLADEKDMSEKAREALQKMKDKFVAEQFEKFKEQNEIVGKLPQVDNYTPKQFSVLQKEAVIKIVDNLLDEYNKSKNAADALQKTAAFAFKTHMEKAQSADFKDLLRYGSESRKGTITKTGDGGYYWQNFYEPKQEKFNPINPAAQRLSMANVLNDWDSFVNLW
jgi:hypothetical protein